MSQWNTLCGLALQRLEVRVDVSERLPGLERMVKVLPEQGQVEEVECCLLIHG